MKELKFFSITGLICRMHRYTLVSIYKYYTDFIYNAVPTEIGKFTIYGDLFFLIIAPEMTAVMTSR